MLSPGPSFRDGCSTGIPHSANVLDEEPAHMREAQEKVGRAYHGRKSWHFPAYVVRKFGRLIKEGMQQK